MSLHGKKRLCKKDKKKNDVVTRFWYTFKEFAPISSLQRLGIKNETYNVLT